MRRLSLLFIILSFATLWVTAQETPLTVVNPIEEFDIGFDCPVAQTLSPDGTQLWVLMEGCFSREFSLKAFNVADSSPIELDRNFSAELSFLKGSWILRWANAMTFTAENTITIIYSDQVNYETHMLAISVDGSEVSPTITDEALNALLLGISEYIDSAVYNADYTMVGLAGYEALHVLDLTTGEEVLSIPLEPDTYNAFPSFSQDGTTLYVAQLDDYENYEASDSTLSVYSLPDGELRGSYAIPAFSFWVSPDEKFVAVQRQSNDNTHSELFVIDLTTGSTSDAFSLYEASKPVTKCLNDNRSMTDLNFVTEGRLWLAGLNWLPDSSGFYITRSYGGNTLSGTPCAFDYSRLNYFEVSTN